MSNKCLLTFLVIAGLCAGPIAAQTIVPIDPATVSDGHVYLSENVGGNLPDDSSNSNDGNLIGAPQVAAGLTGDALQYNGTSDGVHIPDAATINTSTHQNHTFIAVFNCADVSKSEKQVVFEEGGSTRGSVIYVHEGIAYAGAWNRADYTPQWTPGTWIGAPIGSNEWHVVCGVLRGGGAGQEDDKFEMWMDGVLIGKGPGAELRSRSDDNAIGHVISQTFFHDGVGTGGGFWFEGLVDEVWILNEALSEDVLASIGGGKALASAPLPASGATDLPYYSDSLSWDAGEFAAKHNVYLGTNFDDVNDATLDDPRGVLAGDGLTDTAFAIPDPLALETTYFWRVDEVNSPPDNTIFKGEIWDFTVEPVAYEIANVTVTASSVNDEFMGPENTVDGSGLTDGMHNSNMEHMWLNSPAEPTGAWIQYDLGKAYRLNRAHIWNHNSQTESILGYGFKDALIETSLDGETWTELKTVTIDQASGFDDYTGSDVALDDATAQFVRINPLSNHSILGLMQFGLAEVRFYYLPVLAREPMPADGGTSDGVDVTLQWRAGREALQHEVIFSDDEQAVIDGSAVVATVDGLSHDLGTLDLGRSYFWKINSLGDTNYEGDLWTFLTPEDLMVDDMESYKAEEGLFIWEHWIDGFEDDTNGSIVGNDDDAEKTVVYEGSQSLPMAYDNSAAAMSEATLYLDTAVDLTKGNAESLKLQVHGDAPGLVIAGDTVTLGASGVDIWGTADEGRFVYKTLTGDGSITVKVESLADVHPWAKAGVMIRESDGADSADAYMVTSAQSGMSFQYRLETFVAATSDTGTRSDVWTNHNEKPVWVRVERVGDECNGYMSLDGETWEPSTSNPQTVLMIPSVKIGLCATSHDNAVSTVAVFSNITTTGDVTGNWELAEWGVGHPNNDAASMYVRLADTSGKEKIFDHPDPMATILQTWDEWTIPLSDMSPVNPAKLDSITVGVGGSGATGKVYIDAIRTAKPYPVVDPPIEE